jgi:hypothetical protein
VDEISASALLTRLETLEGECRVLSQQNQALKMDLSRIRRGQKIVFAVRVALASAVFACVVIVYINFMKNTVFFGRFFVLKNEAGKQTATLASTTDGSPILNLIDPSNADRVIRIWNNRTNKTLYMELNNGKKKLAIENGPEADEVASITFSDRTGTARLRLGLDRSGSPGLEFLDKNGMRRLDLGLFDDGRPRIKLLGDRQNTIAELKIEARGDGSFSFVDQFNSPLIELRSTAGGASSASFRDGSGRSRLRLETNGVESAPIIRIESGGKSTRIPD